MSLIDRAFSQLLDWRLDVNQRFESSCNPVDQLSVALSWVIREHFLANTLPEVAHGLLRVDLDLAIYADLLATVDFDESVKQAVWYQEIALADSYDLLCYFARVYPNFLGCLLVLGQKLSYYLVENWVQDVARNTTQHAYEWL